MFDAMDMGRGGTVHIQISSVGQRVMKAQLSTVYLYTNTITVENRGKCQYRLSLLNYRRLKLEPYAVMYVPFAA